MDKYFSASEKEFPPGVRRIFRFQIFNSISNNPMMGAPVILYAKYLGASEAVVGLINALVFLMMALQLPVASMVERRSYKRVVLGGWALRTFVVLLIAALPWMTFLTSAAKLWAFGLCMFAYCTIRGVAACGWLPWLSELVAENQRGRYFSTEQRYWNGLGAAAFVCVGLILGEGTNEKAFSLVFFLSAVAGFTSLFYLRQVPDAGRPVEQRARFEGIPWRALLSYRPFLKAVVFQMLFGSLQAAFGIFSVVFMKGALDLRDSQIMWYSATAMLGSMVSSFVSAAVVDRAGGRRVLLLTLRAWCLVPLFFALAAAGVLTPHPVLFSGLFFLAGFLSTFTFAAYMKILMERVPEMGKSHFFALFSFLSSLMTGIVPIAWGLLLDFMGPFRLDFDGLVVDRFTVFFIASAAGMGLIVLGLRFLVQDRALPAARQAHGEPLEAEERESI